ncbi:MAG: hypothetical protein ABI557_19360 [Aureliella sp.]
MLSRGILHISGDGRMTCTHTAKPTTRPPLHVMVIRQHVLHGTGPKISLGSDVATVYADPRRAYRIRRKVFSVKKKVR